MIAALKRLDSREFVSAHALGGALAIAPEAAAALVQQAAGAGLPVQYAAGRGFRLSATLDWLDAARIGAAVADAGLRLRALDCCGSTNSDLLQAARAGAASGEVLAAEWQTHGRGRLGRRWQSGLCTALTFSLLWRFDEPVSALGGLSLATGVAIVRALRRHAVDAALKWPNDVLWQGRKLGGVLIEVQGDAGGPCAAVIGVGINVCLSAGQKLSIDQAVADLHEAGGASLERGEWLAAILLELSASLHRFARSGFAPVRAEWDRYHAHAGRPVELSLPDGSRVHGLAAGVDAGGRLLLATDRGTQPFTAGDVSLRASA